MVPNTRRRGLLSYGARHLGAFELRLPLEWPIRPVWDQIRTQNCTLLQTPEDPQTPFISRKLTGRARPLSLGICTLPTPSARLADQAPQGKGGRLRG